MRITRLIALITLLCGCVTNDRLRVIAYEFSDHPDREGFTVTYSNRSTIAMCLLPEFWPGQAGWINHAEKRIFLLAGSQRFAMKHFNTGYCMGGCPTRVEPGATNTAFVPYRHFDLPADLQSKSKELEFEPSAYPCAAG